MTEMAPVSSTGRIDVIDAFRGFALAGIVLAHMVEQYMGAQPPADLMASLTPGIFDKIVFGLVQFFVVGKFFALFSFLFGLSFFIQMDRAAAKSVDFRGRFIWRLAILFLIGYVHSLFYRGDILTIYAPLGLLLVLFYNVRSDLILALAAIIVAGAGRYAVFALHGDGTILPYGDGDAELPRNAAYFEALRNGSLRDVFAANAVHGHLLKLEYQIGHIGRWYLTFAYFLLGLWAGRSRLFLRIDDLHRTFKKTLWVALACAAGSLVLAGFLFSLVVVPDEGPQFDRWPAMFALTAFDFFNLSLSVVYLCGFVLIFRRPAGGRMLAKLAPYGRMALSNYVIQTLLGTFLLYNWGLGLIGRLTNSDTLLIALAVVALQVVLSTLWLRRYRFGPLEWLWRSGTYLRWQPLQR